MRRLHNRGRVLGVTNNKYSLRPELIFSRSYVRMCMYMGGQMRTEAEHEEEVVGSVALPAAVEEEHDDEDDSDSQSGPEGVRLSCRYWVVSE